MLRVGPQVGSYQLTRLLGKGSFAEVYLGVDIRLGTEVPIKLLHAQLVESGELERFQHEARTIARLEHPNIVRIRHFAVEDGAPLRSDVRLPAPGAHALPGQDNEQQEQQDQTNARHDLQPRDERAVVAAARRARARGDRRVGGGGE
jgi:Protein kinase domain